MKKDLEEKVAMTLARFDKAVKQSSTRRNSDPTAAQQQRQQHPEAAERRELDLAERITAEAEGGPPADKPRCRPWDYEGFIVRQRTFTPLKWFSKPSSASPPVCARHGWVNTARDTLSCECCGAQLRFSEGNQTTSTNSTSTNGGDGDASAGADAGGTAQPASTASASFSSRLKSQHHDLCPWKGNACPKEFLQLPPMAPEDLLEELVERLKSLEPLVTAAALPEVSLPRSFEEHCPGGLSALAAKARTVLAQPALSSPSSSLSLSAAAEVPGGSETAGRGSGGNKRQRGTADGAGGGGGDGDGGRGGLSALGDETLGTAAAIALFGWGSANKAAAVPTASSSGGVDGGGAGGDGGGDGGGGGGASARSPKKAAYRLCCALCNRRLATDNFLTVDVGPRLDADAGVASSRAAAGTAGTAGDGGGGSGRSGKRRRSSGGGTPLKHMDLAAEHRSFCPWAAVHPPEDGEEAAEGDAALPGWRQPLEALLSFADPAEQQQVSSKPQEAEGFGVLATGGKAEEALPKVQKVLGVLMRY